MNTKTNSRRMLYYLSATLIIAFLSCSKQPDYYQIGKKFSEIGDNENAISAYKKALMNSPQNASLRFDLGKAYKENSSYKAAKQFGFAAKIGSPSISDSFLTWGQERIKNYPSSSDALVLFKLSLQANPKNNYALFEKARYIVRYNSYLTERLLALADLEKSLDKSSDEYILNGTFEAIRKNRVVLYHSFAENLTNRDVSYEDYGPAAIYPDGSGMVWVISKKINNKKKFFLVQKYFKDDTVKQLTTLKSWTAFPNFLPDTLQIVYADAGKIKLYDFASNSTKSLCAGYYPSVSHDGEKIAYVRNRDIYTADIDGTGEKRLWRTRAMECLPRFSFNDKKIYFITEYDYDVWFAASDIDGRNKKFIYKIDRDYWQYRERPWLYTFDFNPDSNQTVLNIGGSLKYWDFNKKNFSSLYCTGRYPRFSNDGKFIVSILDAPDAKGRLWKISLVELEKMNQLLDSEKPNRRKLRKLLKKAAN